MGFLELVEVVLDCSLLVGGNLVAQFLNLLLGLEDYSVGMVELVNLFLLLGVGCGVGFSLFLHALDFGVGKTA